MTKSGSWITKQPKRIQRKPKFRVGQVVSIKSFYGNFRPGGGWRHGWQFGKIVKIAPLKKTALFCYFLDGYYSAQTENDLRPLTKREIADGK